ncbi:MAG: FAD:protein FMN transferase, partial [Gemmatimonadetes bacterium]|nr:FAD:protein FMN transferase [Gemmatimonadota bacterium]
AGGGAVWGPPPAPGGARPPPAAVDSARALVDWRRVDFEAAARSVRLPVPGMRLDLDALARGYAADRAAVAMRAAGLDRGMVDVGESVLVFGPPPPGTGAWGVGVLDPRNPDRVLGVVTPDSGAVATTADYGQGFMVAGERFSRTIDPRTGAPSSGTTSATAAAPSALAAVALSAAFFVLGPDRGCETARALGVDGLWIRDVAGGAVVATPALLDRLQLSAEGGPVWAPRACGR